MGAGDDYGGGHLHPSLDQAHCFLGDIMTIGVSLLCDLIHPQGNTERAAFLTSFVYKKT